MTVEEAKSKYGDSGTGYVKCGNCPLDSFRGEKCPEEGCRGMDNAWEAIAKYLTEQEEKDHSKKPKRLVYGNPVDHPDHYNQGEIECIDAMIAAFGKEKVCDWCVMTSFKYHWRYQHKNGDEDICKASWYIDKYKELKELGS